MSTRSPRGFTLVEMLVVLGIVGVLAALLLPAVMRAMSVARNTAVSLEVNQIASAIEAYKQDKGDYPPNFRDSNIVLRHIRKCYPKADPVYVNNFVNYACFGGANTTSIIDEGESLVFWLTMTDADPRYPFLSYFYPTGAGSLAAAPKKYLDIDDSRLEPVDTSEEQTVNNVGQFYDVRPYKAKNCKDTDYIYIDSRSYAVLTNFAANPAVYAYSGGTMASSSNQVRPYWSTASKAMNPTTFQLLCAGQDGDWGALATTYKLVETGQNYDAGGGDNDNITNFSNGRTLAEAIK